MHFLLVGGIVCEKFYGTDRRGPQIMQITGARVEEKYGVRLPGHLGADLLDPVDALAHVFSQAVPILGIDEFLGD